jgi:hypothetical protein
MKSTIENSDFLKKQGRFFGNPSQTKLPLIVIVPFYRAPVGAPKRHIQLFEQLGYSGYRINLQDDPWMFTKKSLFSKTGAYGAKSVWADQIELILNSIPGQKIVFCFSNPSSSTIEAIGRRQATDIAGLICDSGPAGFFWSSALNLFREKTAKKSFLVGNIFFGSLYATLTEKLWSLDILSSLKTDLKKFPDKFKILSIRGWKDHLISPDSIDAVFADATQLNVIKLSLPDAGHLDGLKKSPAEYQQGLKNFLNSL